MNAKLKKPARLIALAAAVLIFRAINPAVIIDQGSAALSSDGGYYDALTDIQLQFNAGRRAGEAIYQAALPEIQKFARDTLAFMQRSDVLNAPAYEALSQAPSYDRTDRVNGIQYVSPETYYDSVNTVGRFGQLSTHYTGLLNNSSALSNYETGLRNLQRNPLIEPYLSGTQAVR